MQDHTKLRVWQRALALDIYVHRATQHLNPREAGTLRSQLRRSVASIAANIAEGAGQATAAQFARFLVMAVASCSESLNHLAKAISLQLFAPAVSSHIHDELHALRAMSINLSKRVQSSGSAADRR